MSGSIPPLPVYAFLARTGTTDVYLYEPERQAISVMDHFHFVCGCLAPDSLGWQRVICNSKCVAISTNIVVRVLNTVYPFLVNITCIYFQKIQGHCSFFCLSVQLMSEFNVCRYSKTTFVYLLKNANSSLFHSYREEQLQPVSRISFRELEVADFRK